MIRYAILFLILIFSVCKTEGQGCSDAGACTIPSVLPTAATEMAPQKNEFGVGITAGAADHSIFVLTPSVRYERSLGSALSLDLRGTLSMHSGLGVSNTGLGDIFLNLNYFPSSKFSISGGLKIPLADGNQVDGEQFLPMDYQSSLGTLDVIGGVGYHSAGWQVAAAVQIPLTQSENWFYPDSIVFPDSPFNDFESTFLFHRKADVLLRVSRVFGMQEGMSIIPGLLAIYHTAEDEREGNAESFEPIAGSDGLTLNATVYWNMDFGEKSMLSINLGFPLVVREVRPDGLTRSFVLGVDYSVRF